MLTRSLRFSLSPISRTTFLLGSLGAVLALGACEVQGDEDGADEGASLSGVSAFTEIGPPDDNGDRPFPREEVPHLPGDPKNIHPPQELFSPVCNIFCEAPSMVCAKETHVISPDINTKVAIWTGRYHCVCAVGYQRVPDTGSCVPIPTIEHVVVVSGSRSASVTFVPQNVPGEITAEIRRHGSSAVLTYQTAIAGTTTFNFSGLAQGTEYDLTMSTEGQRLYDDSFTTKTVTLTLIASAGATSAGSAAAALYGSAGQAVDITAMAENLDRGDRLSIYNGLVSLSCKDPDGTLGQNQNNNIAPQKSLQAAEQTSLQATVTATFVDPQTACGTWQTTGYRYEVSAVVRDSFGNVLEDARVHLITL